MNFVKLLSIQSAIWGVMGSLVFIFPIMFTSIQETLYHTGNIGYGHGVVGALMRQKANSIIGFSLISLAFLSQLILIVRKDRLEAVIVPLKKAWLIIYTVSAGSVLVIFLLRVLILKWLEYSWKGF